MTDPLLVEAAVDVFADVCTHEALHAAERDGWSATAWSAVSEMGLPWISVPEEAGGQGGELDDALAVLRVAGRYALPLPLAETGMLGGWLLASAGLTVPEAPVTVAPGSPHDDLRSDGRALSGTAHRVPWATASERVVVLLEVDGQSVVASVPTAGLRIESVTNLAGEPRETVHFDGVTLTDVAPAGAGVDARALRLRGALSRVVLAAGALDRLQEMTVQYTSEREQFGKPVGRFQAVQQHLVHVAQQRALLGAAADVAGREAARGGGAVEIACAKVLVDDAVEVAARASHQAHGAMGMTQEYPLHHITRRLWSWRKEYGGATEWSRWLGELAAGRGADSLYPLITGGSAALSA
ncbi:MAG: acyl-CoA dehydrogenase [Frankiales bacterium]|nr:acyl-CoA dehydrogenase [Frankiales bacterium]